MARPFSDNPRRALVVLAATLIGMAITARLGVWQMSRASQKESLQATLQARRVLPPLQAVELLPRTEREAAAQHYRPVKLRGEWVPNATVFLDNRQMNGRVGFFVVTPLRIAPGEAVLVQRGWVPRDMQVRTRLPEVPTPEGVIEVDGLLLPPPARLFEFDGAAASGPIRQNLVLGEFSRETGVSLLPWSVQASGLSDVSKVSDALLRHWPLPAAGVDKHHGYAFQWFGLCALMAVLYVWFQLVRPRLSRAEPERRD
jgi:surfeit locus 1 family protein